MDRPPIPSVIDIETVHGYCNASCVMCSIRSSSLAPRIMTTDLFRRILDRLSVYVSHIEYLNIVGLGEALMDPELGHKIRLAKAARFRRVSLPTNGSLLDERRATEALESGVDIVIFSVDSLEAEHFETIRKGLTLERVLANVKGFVARRDAGGYATAICVRMIEQSLNTGEWESYTEYWDRILSKERGDMVLRFPAHNWADAAGVIPKQLPCPYVFDRITINAYGQVQFCCIDIDGSFFKLGNAEDEDPVAIFQGEVFTKARQLMLDGHINDIRKCAHCDVPLQRSRRGRAEQRFDAEEAIQSD